MLLKRRVPCENWPVRGHNLSIFMQSFLTRASIKTLEIHHSCTQVIRIYTTQYLNMNSTAANGHGSTTTVQSVWGAGYRAKENNIHISGNPTDPWQNFSFDWKRSRKGIFSWISDINLWPLTTICQKSACHLRDYPPKLPDYRHTDKSLGLVTTTLYSKCEGNCLLLHSASRAPNIDHYVPEIRPWPLTLTPTFDLDLWPWPRPGARHCQWGGLTDRKIFSRAAWRTALAPGSDETRTRDPLVHQQVD